MMLRISAIKESNQMKGETRTKHPTHTHTIEARRNSEIYWGSFRILYLVPELTELFYFSVLKSTGVADKQNGQSTHSLSHTPAEVGVPVKLARTPKDTLVRSGSVQQAASDGPYARRKLRLRLSYKTYGRAKASCAEPSA